MDHRSTVALCSFFGAAVGTLVVWAAAVRWRDSRWGPYSDVEMPLPELSLEGSELSELGFTPSSIEWPASPLWASLPVALPAVAVLPNMHTRAWRSGTLHSRAWHSA